MFHVKQRGSITRDWVSRVATDSAGGVIALALTLAWKGFTTLLASSWRNARSVLRGSAGPRASTRTAPSFDQRSIRPRPGFSITRASITAASLDPGMPQSRGGAVKFLRA